MRSCLFRRLGPAVGCAVLLWLAGVSAANAAPLARRQAGVTRAAWDSHLAGRRARVGAVPQRARTRAPFYLLGKHRLVLRHVTTWLERRHSSPFRADNEEALQNSVPALGGQDDLLLASLVPIGVLTVQRCRIPVNGAVTPRPPRGPPTSLA